MIIIILNPFDVDVVKTTLIWMMLTFFFWGGGQMNSQKTQTKKIVDMTKYKYK